MYKIIRLILSIDSILMYDKIPSLEYKKPNRLKSNIKSNKCKKWLIIEIIEIID